MASHPPGQSLKPFMTGLFKGIVLLFLLDVGMLAARNAGKLVEVRPKLVAFGVVGVGWEHGRGCDAAVVNGDAQPLLPIG